MARVFSVGDLETLPEGADFGIVPGEPYDVEISNHYG